MFPISIAGSISIGSPPGEMSPASTERMSTSSKLKSRPGVDPDQVLVGAVGAAEVALALDRRVLDHRHVRADRADEPGRASRSAISSAVAWRNLLAERVRELDLVQAMVAAHEREHEAALRGDDRDRLQRRALGHAQRTGDLLDGGQPGRRHLRGARRAPGGSSTGCGARRRRPPRSPRSRARARPRSPPPRRAPCTRGRRSRPSSPRRTRPGTSAGRSGRRSGRRPGCGARRSGRGPRRRGRTSRSPSS